MNILRNPAFGASPSGSRSQRRAILAKVIIKFSLWVTISWKSNILPVPSTTLIYVLYVRCAYIICISKCYLYAIYSGLRDPWSVGPHKGRRLLVRSTRLRTNIYMWAASPPTRYLALFCINSTNYISTTTAKRSQPVVLRLRRRAGRGPNFDDAPTWSEAWCFAPAASDLCVA